MLGPMFGLGVKIGACADNTLIDETLSCILCKPVPRLAAIAAKSMLAGTAGGPPGTVVAQHRVSLDALPLGESVPGGGPGKRIKHFEKGGSYEAPSPHPTASALSAFGGCG